MLLRKPFEGHEDDMSKLPRRARNAVLAKRRANEERQQVKWKCSGGVGAGDYCSSSVLFDLGLSLCLISKSRQILNLHSFIITALAEFKDREQRLSYIASIMPSQLERVLSRYGKGNTGKCLTDTQFPTASFAVASALQYHLIYFY